MLKRKIDFRFKKARKDFENDNWDAASSNSSIFSSSSGGGLNESYEEDYQKIQSENKKMTYEFRLRMAAITLGAILIVCFEACFKKPVQDFSL